MNKSDEKDKVQISIGNTTMEALSAYLAHELAEEFGIEAKEEDFAKRMERLEDQLESLHLSGKLANRKLDIGPKFREARHNSGFTAVASGVRWAVRLQSRPSTSAIPAVAGKNGGDTRELQNANAAHAQVQRRVILPPEMTAQLSKLNDLQNQYDTAQRKIGDRRKQLFSDWYKYMMSAYHPADTVRGDDYPDVDEVQFFIEEKDIKPLEKIIGKAEGLKSKIGKTKETFKQLTTHYNHSLIVHLRPYELRRPYDLRLMSVSTSDDLVKNGRLLVVVALVGTKLHIRIFDASGEKFIDKPEGKLVSGQKLKDLKKLVETQFPDEPKLSPEKRQEIIETATLIAGHTPQGLLAASFTGRLDHNLQFSEDSEPAGTNTNPAFAQCLSFDGEASYAKVKWEAPPSKARPGVTLSAWIKPDLKAWVKPDQEIEGKPNRTVFAIGELVLQLQPITPGATSRITVACPEVDERIGVISPGRWHHLAITCENVDAPNLVVYIDGRRFPLQSGNEISEKLNKFDPLFIGARSKDDGAGFQGKMTQVRVDNRALMPAEVRRDMNGGARPIYQRYKKAAPRYWQPNEPVILMVGKGIRATERHGQDGALECLVTDSLPEAYSLPEALKKLVSGVSPPPGQTAIHQAIDDITKNAKDGSPAPIRAISQEITQREWKGQPWHPIMLEWEVLLQPARGTKDIEGAAFAPDVITANYNLHDNAVDLKVKEKRRELAAGTVYSNSCYLTPHGGTQLQERIAEYLNIFLDDLKEKVHEFQAEKAAAAEAGTLADNPQSTYRQALSQWFTNRDEAISAWLQSKAQQNSEPKQPLAISAELLKTLKHLKQWYEEKPIYAKSTQKFEALEKTQKANDPIYVVICAGLELFDDDGEPLTFLSQSLGGFNDELLMHKNTMQLPVADPLGFDDYQTFTKKVAELLGDSIHTAPEPTNQFNPIRTGAMSVTRLRLVDTFGQVKDFKEEAILAADHEIITPQRLTVPHSPHLTWMPPRLVQPVRVDFRWLRAVESDPDATPICGWVLPNNLQKTLAVYDHRGRALGSILKRGSTIQWEPAPGRNREVDEIKQINPHLAKMVRHILNKGDSPNDKNKKETAKNFLEDFLTAIESALETIDPEGHAQHRSLALLMGRPIAVVRASLDLQLQGAPAVHQGWHAFQADLRRATRETDGFTGVKFPVRIGEYQQLNDGVVGYWIEEKVDPAGDDYRYRHDQDDKGKASIGKDGTFYAPQTPDNATNTSIDHPDINIHQKDEPVHIKQTIDSPPLTATLLFDPRGKVHLTSGLLPTKVIDIPAEEYAEALEAIEVTFLTAPILTAHGTRSVAVPDEPGFAWSWQEHERWLDKKVFVESLQAQDSDGQISEGANKLWERLHECGWITAEDANKRTRLIPMGRRKSEQFDVIDEKVFNERLAKLLHLELDDIQIEAVWQHLLEAKIGWLKVSLAKAADSESSLYEIVPKNRRRSQCLNSESLSGLEPVEVGKQVENLFTNYIKDELSDTWTRFDKDDRGESISRLEDRIERLFWSEYASAPIMERVTFLDRLKTLSGVSDEKLRRSVWDHLLENKVHWLSAIPADPTRARVVPIDERRKTDLELPPEWIAALKAAVTPTGDGESAATRKWVERILNTEALELSPVETQARFGTQQEIREGWLVLKNKRDET